MSCVPCNHHLTELGVCVLCVCVHVKRLVDASEMVPTYGTDHGEFRGFVEGGWEACGNKDGTLDLTTLTEKENLCVCVCVCVQVI